MPWEKPVPHHKWADELEAEAKAKSDLRKAKLEAKKEDHSKKCPFCGNGPVVEQNHPDPANPDDEDEYKDTYECPGCDRVYRVKCPGTILLDGNPVIAQGSEQ